jgi:hypothetical protein
MSERFYVVDAFTITGVFLLLLALATFVSNEGVFNAVTWGFGKIFDMFRSVPKNNLKYFEYVEAKREKDKIFLWPTVIVGTVFFLVGILIYLISL